MNRAATYPAHERQPWLSARLSGLELLTGWEALGLGVPPPLLPLFSPAQTHREHQRLRAGALRTLGERGLTQAGQPGLALGERGLAEAGQPAPALAEALRLLARPDYQLDLRFGDGPDRMLLGLGAVAGAHGLVVVSDGSPAGPFDLQTMDAVRVAGTLLELLWPIRPGVGCPVNVPADLLDRAHDAADGDLWAMADRLQRDGVPRLDATSLVRMVTGIRAGGQLGVTAGDRRGPWVIGFHATDTGWFRQVRRPDGPAGHTVTVCPTDAAGLHRQWTELIHHLRPPH